MGPVRTLMVDGWNSDAREAAGALTSTGAFEIAAIVDRSGLALVDARRTSGAPCSQFVGQTLDAERYNAVLLASPEHLTMDAKRAARRSAALIVLGDLASGAALRDLADTARAHDVPLHVMRPALHDPGIDDLLAKTAMPGWSPRTVDVTVEAPADVERLLPVATALATRLIEGLADGMTLAATGTSRLATAMIETNGCFAALRARHAPAAFVRITGDSLAGAFDLRIEGSTGRLTVAPNEGVTSTRVRHAVDAWAGEATRVASTPSDDLATATTEAALQHAVEAALARHVEPSMVAFARPALTLLRGGLASMPRGHRAGTLHLVGAP